MEKKLPTNVYALIDMLDRLYPNKTPEPGTSPDKMWHSIGQRSVINKLLHMRKLAERD